MAKYRRGRINEEVVKELSSILREVKDPRVSDAFISVTAAEVATDMKTETVNGVNVGYMILSGVKPDALRTLGDKIKDKDPLSVCAICSVDGEKGNLLIVCGKEAVAKGLNAGKLVKETAVLLGGGGGGRPDSAMGGINKTADVEKVLANFKDIVSAGM